MSPPAITFRQFGKDCLAGLSLANLSLLRIWSALLTKDSSSGYTTRHPSRPVDLAAAVLAVFLLGAFFALGATVARRLPRGLVLLHWAAVLSLVLPINAARQVLINSLAGQTEIATIRNGGWRLAVVIVGFGGTLAWIAAMWMARRRIARIVSIGLLICSPFVLVTFAEAAFAMATYRPAAYADQPLAVPLQSALPQRRVLWLIFDEMDQRLAFAEREAGLRLPELDKLRAESFYASDAQSPARVTLLSLPSLLSGRLVAHTSPLGPGDLLVTYASGMTAHWGNAPNVFSRAREAGFDSALAGWYHPYGRTLNQSLTKCVWVESPIPDNSLGDELTKISVNQIRSLFETGALSPFGQSLTVQHQVRNYREVLRAATAYSTDPKLGVVFLHFPIPHPPYIYNARTQRFDLTNSPVRGYIDALALADRTFGELRRSMESAGVWDRTAVLVSADHGYRADRSVDGGRITDRWVPFLLKLPGHQPPYEYQPLLETVRSADLLLEILEGKISTPAEVAAALDPSRPPVSAVRK